MTELMNTREVAEKAEVTIPTVTRWVQAGNLKPAHKGHGLRGGYVFERTEVERWLAERLDTFLK